jgi:hypothetical protein
MSRGFGKVERQILDVLTRAGTGLEIRTLTGILDGLNERQVRQAVQRLNARTLPVGSMPCLETFLIFFVLQWYGDGVQDSGLNVPSKSFHAPDELG